MGQKCKVMAIILLLAGLIFIGIGFNKITKYKNSETYYSTNVNAYVGGDAYNYIINGTYFTGYSVLGGSCLIMSTIFCATSCVISSLESKKNENYISNDNNNSSDELPPL